MEGNHIGIVLLIFPVLIHVGWLLLTSSVSYTFLLVHCSAVVSITKNILLYAVHGLSSPNGMLFHHWYLSSALLFCAPSFLSSVYDHLRSLLQISWGFLVVVYSCDYGCCPSPARNTQTKVATLFHTSGFFEKKKRNKAQQIWGFVKDSLLSCMTHGVSC